MTISVLQVEALASQLAVPDLQRRLQVAKVPLLTIGGQSAVTEPDWLGFVRNAINAGHDELPLERRVWHIDIDAWSARRQDALRRNPQAVALIENFVNFVLAHEPDALVIQNNWTITITLRGIETGLKPRVSFGFILYTTRSGREPRLNIASEDDFARALAYLRGS